MNDITCPRCGKFTQGLVDGLCTDCFFKTSNLIEIPLVLYAKMCSTCGAQLARGRWNNEHNIEEIVTQTVEDALLIHEKADDIELAVEPKQMTPHLYRAFIEANATILGEPVQQTAETEVRIVRIACDMCSRMSGKYFEAILQIRAARRYPTEEEKARCMSIINGTLGKMLKKGDRMAFISDTAEARDGIDLYMGSANATRIICKEIVSELGGGFTESSSLFGRKDGKEIYRMTFSLRLPEFMPGDIVELGKKVIEIRKFSKSVTGTDLIKSSRFSSSPDDMKGATLVAKRSTAKKAVVVSMEKDEMMLLDPDTYETVTVKVPVPFSASEGDEVPVIRASIGLVALPDEASRKEGC
ncbi:MAG: ribosomal export protein [Methanolobus sp.]|jgi:nonsense-mediated mRNA decay protein 3|nr:ribosomal export protein [Methanolobus sp.]MDK2833932.1 ribosomal export protein [Methanolobus sp.]MDK2911938.1 ribosomal export protein [Methanolobus sp.]MDN5310744.1 ribosomal export protein [Methanolobus sp.]